MTKNAAAGVDQAVITGSRLYQDSTRPLRPTPIDTAQTQDEVSSGLSPATLAAWNTRMKVPP
ncbi:hypothetical protein D3C81_1704820 [compost metagenome]